MGHNRRTFIITAAAALSAAGPWRTSLARDDTMKDRISRDLQGWDAIRDHRTGTAGDQQTARWLAEQIRAAGAQPELTRFDFQRRVPGECFVSNGRRRAVGVPLFDGGSTGPEGVSGPLGALARRHPVGLAFYEPFSGHPDTRRLDAARRENRHQAIVAVAAGKSVKPGLALLNADRFGKPFGPPVLQVATEHGNWLRTLAGGGATITVAAPGRTEPCQVTNVQARIRGSQPDLAPLVVMTPRSAWWTCTSERGGGISIWLEALRRFSAAPPARDTIFIANTGHELGHVGLEHFLRSGPGLVRGAHCWVHLGANFAAAGGDVLYQASDAGLMDLGLEAVAAAGAAQPNVTEVGQRPLGEARDIFDGGGRYVSLLGSNPLFHHPDDRWPGAVDLTRTERLMRAMLQVITRLSRA